MHTSYEWCLQKLIAAGKVQINKRLESADLQKIIRSVRDPTDHCLWWTTQKLQSAQVLGDDEDDETDEEKLACQHHVWEGEWARGE